MARQVKRLAQADQVATEDLETTLFLQALEGRFGVDYLAFNAADMRHKLACYVASTGTVSVSALQGRILRDEALGAEVIRMLGRSSAPAPGDIFRVMALRCAMLPILRSSPWPAVWLADCSHLWDLVLLLALLQEEDLLKRTRVFMTSNVEQAINGLQSLSLSAEDVRALQKLHQGSGGRNDLSTYLQRRDDEFVLDPALLESTSWHVHNLATDASFGEFQAVVASRPLSEYGNALRERAMSVFGRSLCSFGVLQIDDLHATRPAGLGHQFTPVLPSYGVYRKAGSSSSLHKW
jgi:chemotaxis protein methyltransferase CheR